MIPRELIDSLKEPFKNSKGFPGSGTLLAFKIVMSTLENFVLVTSNKHIAQSDVSVPVVVAENVPAAARGISHAEKVVAFAGDTTTWRHLNALNDVKEDLLYICINNHGSEKTGKRDIKMVSPSVTAAYKATANIGYPEDLVTKLRKASDMKGLSFIEIFAPSPYLWEYEPSITVELARMATSCAIWPVIEISTALNITRSPLRPVPVEQYFNMIGVEVDIKKIQNEVTRRWKHLVGGRLI